MTKNATIKKLKSFANPKVKAGMHRFAAGGANTLGVSMPNIRKLGKDIGKNHELALKLWNSGIHEARILASIIAEPGKVTKDLMDDWVSDFDSWDICDQVCGNLFDRTPFYYEMALKWSEDDREFVRRAAFAVMAWAAVHDKKANDDQFINFLRVIKITSIDDRNYVKKAVNWALRQIGKSRNINLYKLAIKTAEEILEMSSTTNPKSNKLIGDLDSRFRGNDKGLKTAKWIAGDALRELKKPYITKRF